MEPRDRERGLWKGSHVTVIIAVAAHLPAKHAALAVGAPDAGIQRWTVRRAGHDSMGWTGGSTVGDID
jgi:hypothetical protein